MPTQNQSAGSMALTYSIIETQLRLIRALQRGYIEALEAGDWQAAEYRCLHLQRLCEGLQHLSQLLDREGNAANPSVSKAANGWINSVRSLAPGQSADTGTIKPMNSNSTPPDPSRYEWGGGGNANSQGIEPPPIDEVWGGDA